MAGLSFPSAVVAVALLAAGTGPSLAWGSKGHRIIGELATQHLPPELPAFLRTAKAVRQIGELAREPDRSRDAGQPHDGAADPGHFVDVSDDGSILGGPALSALPPTREAYESYLRTAGVNMYKAGYLPYTIMEGWQQLVKDFALWRAAAAGAKFAKAPADRAWFTADGQLREMLILRDLGVWAHYVGDGSQPLHASVHYNGWGDDPNPRDFGTAPGLHARFETDFINAHIVKSDVAALLPAPVHCACSIQVHTMAFLAATQAHVEETYKLDKEQAFDPVLPLKAPAKHFAAQRIADGAGMLRDMVTDAWRQSAEAQLGYPDKISMHEIEAGRADPLPLLKN